MVTISILMLIAALLSHVLLKYMLPKINNLHSRAMALLAAWVLLLFLGLLTLVMWYLANKQNAFSEVEIVDTLNDFTSKAVSPNTYLAIEGQISPNMYTKKGEYVAYLRSTRGIKGKTNETYFDYPAEFEIALSDGGTVFADAHFVKNGDDARPGYHNWPRVIEGYDTYQHLKHGTPVFVIGKTAVATVNTNQGQTQQHRLTQTEMLMGGTRKDFSQLAAPIFYYWAIFGWTVSILAFLYLINATLKTYPKWQEIYKNPEFQWTTLLKNIQIK